MDEFLESFKSSLQTGFIDKTILSSETFQPELLINQTVPPKKVLSTLLSELDKCEQFLISVAFVTTEGVAVLINKLKELEGRGIKGQVLVSQYLNFSEPQALKKLLRFKNIDLKISTSGNSHSKGYIFKNEECYNIIVGSSNLTASALTKNKEWNIKVSALSKSGIVDKVLKEFYSDFSKGTEVTNEFISNYEDIYNKQRILQSKVIEKDLKFSANSFSPNSMQKDALSNLKKIREEGKNKALIISATGTGKTYLSAFDVKNFNAKKILFVVHRLTIAKDSLKTFRNVFGRSKTMGVYSGNQRDLDCDFVFSTIQTISKRNHLENFPENHFDYIIIDETHRSGADSYMRLIEHFKPRFLLGMTATPERTDGKDIFKLFDYNIAYEIRLNRALEEEMLSSFHYYGVTDLSIDNIEIERKSDFKYLVSSERVERIVEQASFYGSDNGITRGLIFCSKKKEAFELSELLNAKGLKTIALTGEDNEEARVRAIDRLETDDLTQKLDYILTVDIFNEGIDIPKINQIIMLRPTDSAIVFIQQLGRGLRKSEGKGYLTVIDFIGNYENNYLIPIALYGDKSYNKDTLRKLISEGSRMIPGTSTINFDEITKEKIFQSIDSANMQLLADLKKDYNLMKFKLGRIPMMMDFIEHGSRDPYLFVDYSNSFYNFILKAEKISKPELSEEQIKLLELFSKEINNSKRLEESIILKSLIEGGGFSVRKLKEYVFENYHYSVTEQTVTSCISNLNFEFIREKKNGRLLSVKEIYNFDIISLVNGIFVISDAFKQHLKVSKFKTYLLDSTHYAIYEFDRQYEREKWQEGFVLYRKYSRKDVFRILNVAENPVAQNVGGYLVSSDNEHCPIFVNYHKEDHISESTKYEDKFLNNYEFEWMSKSNRRLNSKDVQSILGKNGSIRLPLFIKKSNDEGMDFYYMGDLSPESNFVQQTTIFNDKGKKLPVVKIRFNLGTPVSENMYNYLHDMTGAKILKDEGLDDSAVHSNVLVNPIPLYDFYAAAGSFSELQSEKSYTLIEGPGNYSGPNYFACKIVGESMNRVIPNGSICLFRIYTGGTRNGKIVLVENKDIQDPDFNSAFTIKTYSSQKKVSEDHWEHTSVVLRPNSLDPSFKDIEINEHNAESMRVVGEFIKVLESSEY